MKWNVDHLPAFIAVAEQGRGASKEGSDDKP